MEKRSEKKQILLIDMYGVIIKESKGYFIPYTFEHFDRKEHDRLTKAFREDCLFTKAGNGYLSSDEFFFPVRLSRSNRNNAGLSDELFDF